MMYEKFTDRARKVMQLANQEARRRCDGYIGTEHILLGIVKEGSGVAARVLQERGIDLHKIRLEVEKVIQPMRSPCSTGRLPQSPRTKNAVGYAIEESRALNHNYVETEHLLLGLLREYESVAAQILVGLGITLEKVRDSIKNYGGVDTLSVLTPEVVTALESVATALSKDKLLAALKEYMDQQMPDSLRQRVCKEFISIVRSWE